jgi:hypothetical protein
MSNRECLELVEKYISAVKKSREKKFSNSAEQLAYERGILTGLLANLMDKDSYIKGLIKRLAAKIDI